MVLTRDIREEIESSVSQALNKCMKNDSFIKTIVNKVTEAVIKTINNKLLNLEETVQKFQSKQSELKSDLEEKINKLEDEIQEAKLCKRGIEADIERMDQESRRLNLRIFGFEERTKEDTKKELIKFLNSKMSTTLSEEDIEFCFRIGKKIANKNRGILIRLFTRYQTRDLFQEKITERYWTGHKGRFD